MKQPISFLKNLFSDFKIPTGQNFGDMIDSFFHKDVKIPASSVEGWTDDSAVILEPGVMELPELGNKNKSTKVFGGATGKTYTYKGTQLPILPNNEGILFWNATPKVWGIQDQAPMPKGQDGKTAEPFNSLKEGGYLIADQIYFGGNTIYSAIVNVPQGQSPLTNSEKWKLVFEGGSNTYYANSNNLVSAIAEISLTFRKEGVIVQFVDVNKRTNNFKYMGKFYEEVAFLSETCWLDLDNKEKFDVYYFLNKPDLRNSQGKKTISQTTFEIVDSANDYDYVSDFIRVDKNIKIATVWNGKYIAYNSDKVKISAAFLNGGKTFLASNADNYYIKVSYQYNYITWNYGYKQASASVPTDSLPHVSVLPAYNRLYELDQIEWREGAYQGQANIYHLSPLVPVKMGQTFTQISYNSDVVDKSPATNYFFAFFFDAGGIFLERLVIGGQLLINKSEWKFVRFYTDKLKQVIIVDSDVKNYRTKLGWILLNWLLLGDSITSNTITYAALGYPVLTGLAENIKVNNGAVSGYTVTTLFNKVTNFDFTIYDFTTICIGTNDYSFNTPIATFKTQYQTLISKIRDVNPRCKIGLMTLFRRSGITDSSTNAGGTTWLQFNNTIRDLAKENGLPLLDIQNECQLNPNIQYYKDEYTTTADGVHPTNEAHKEFIYPLVREFVKKLKPTN
jgi:lysophospholipase L1-like esterase